MKKLLSLFIQKIWRGPDLLLKFLLKFWASQGTSYIFIILEDSYFGSLKILIIFNQILRPLIWLKFWGPEDTAH
jgi:hypothetical protein